MDFATALKAAREQMGLTQTELGKALHVSFSTINRYENGRHMGCRIRPGIYRDLDLLKDSGSARTVCWQAG